MVLGSFWTLVSSPVTMGERTAAWERPRSRYTSKSHIAPQRKRWDRDLSTILYLSDLYTHNYFSLGNMGKSRKMEFQL